MSKSDSSAQKNPSLTTDELEKNASAPSAAQDKQIEAKLLEDINLSLNLPLPEHDPYWQLEGTQIGIQRKGIFNFFKRKTLSAEKLNELRQDAENRPGVAQIKIQLLRKKHRENKSLIILNAMCTAKKVMGSSNRKEMLSSLKSASREAGAVLMDDGISPFNCNVFFNIYFDYLSKIKRVQATTYKRIQEDTGLKSYRNRLARAFNICDILLEEKERGLKVLNRIQNSLKSANQYLPWLFHDIQTAARKVEAKNFQAICGPAEAKEIFGHTLALTDIFARVPVLFPLADAILKLIPENNTAFILRKRSILVSKAFTELNIAIQAEDTKRMRSLGRQIHSSAKEDLFRIANRPVNQGFEANPYLSLGRVAIITYGLYNEQEQQKMLSESLKAMKIVADLDKSKNNTFRKAALKMAKKISSLRSGNEVNNNLQIPDF